MSRKSLDLEPRRSFSWLLSRNPNPCAPPTLNPPSDCWLAERPLGAPQAVAFQTSTVASAAVVECTLQKKKKEKKNPVTPPFFTHTWVLLPPRVFPHCEFGCGVVGEQNCVFAVKAPLTCLSLSVFDTSGNSSVKVPFTIFKHFPCGKRDT